MRRKTSGQGSVFVGCEVGFDGFFDEFGAGCVGAVSSSGVVDFCCEAFGEFYCDPVSVCHSCVTVDTSMSWVTYRRFQHQQLKRPYRTRQSTNSFTQERLNPRNSQMNHK